MKSFLAVLFGTTLSVLSSLAQAQQTVVLVRHAELMGGQAMAEPKHVPLSEAGEARAKRLASFLKDSGISAIYVTDFVRTNKTAEPLSRELKMAPTVLPKGDPAALVERLRDQHRGGTVLLVGHSDTLPGLIRALGHPQEIKIEPQDYGNLFIVVPKAGDAPTFLRLHY